ncbi:unnamed protein product [Phytophthora lilii]|uniref:RxLR effector protein n=1 Tax=Phytophthora lilii TaxID=2077276 RepID=A0A9W6TE31_9STRA|nr:unnamed protein product [Phytophthora lilii]
MHLVILVSITVTSLVSSGNALSTTTDSDQIKISQLAPPYVVNTAAAVENNGERNLRTGTRINDEEERGKTWAFLKGLLPDETEKEIRALKKLASTFQGYQAADKMPYDAYKAAKRMGYSRNEAVKYGMRYEKYLENPSAYHR